MSTLATTAPASGTRLHPLVWTVAAGAALAVTGVLVDPAAGWAGILTAAVYGISLALGGALFVAIKTASGARWWLSFRDAPLDLAATLPVPAAALLLCLVVGLQVLYPWARPGGLEGHLHEKAAWLNPPLFLARAVVILAVWIAMIAALRRGSARTSISFLLVFAATFSVASWDWTMSLEPEWYSTVYAVYGFAGCFLGGIAAVAALCLGLGRARLSDAQRHDLGKMLFAFSAFWAYLWFCQFLLIWYADIPEETSHFVTRTSGGWAMLFYLNPVLSFAIPFVALLSVPQKKNEALLLQVSLFVLAGRWLDGYLAVAPAVVPASVFPTYAVAATAAVLGGMAALLPRRA